MSAFTSDSDHRSDARKINQHESHQCQSDDGRECMVALCIAILSYAFAQSPGGFVAVVTVARIDDTEGAHYDLLGCHTCQQAYAHFPIETDRCQYGLNGFAESSDVGLFLLFDMRFAIQLFYLRCLLLFVKLRITLYLFDLGDQYCLFRVARVIAEEPNDDRSKQDDATHFAQILCCLIPHVYDYGARGRHTIGGEFHDEGNVFYLEKCFFEKTRQ